MSYKKSKYFSEKIWH